MYLDNLFRTTRLWAPAAMTVLVAELNAYIVNSLTCCFSDLLLSFGQSADYLAWKLLCLHRYEQSKFATVDVSTDLSDMDLAELLAKETQQKDLATELVLTPGCRLVPYFRRLNFSQMQPIEFEDEGIYIISGGTGSLGLLTARRMVELGAKKIVLLSRSSRPREDAMDAWKWLQQCQSNVIVKSCDVFNLSSCLSALRTLREELGGPICGIVHAAGRADAAPITRQTSEVLLRTSSAKVLGAMNLHLASVELRLNLQFFVMYSSVSVLFSPAAAGAAGYSAANSMLDSLSHFRHAQGLPSISIQWGAWSEAGLAARHHGVVGMLQRSGIQPITSEVGLAAFEHLLRSGTSQVMVTPMDWDILAQHSTPLQAPFLRLAARSSPNLGMSANHTVAATSSSISIKKWFEAVIKNLFCGYETSTTSLFSMTWTELGMDSMSSVHLLQSIARHLQITLSLDFFCENDTPEKTLAFLEFSCKGGSILAENLSTNTSCLSNMGQSIPLAEWLDRQLQDIVGQDLLQQDYRSELWAALGMDSMSTVHLLQMVSRDLGITLSLEAFTESDTPAKFLSKLAAVTGSPEAVACLSASKQQPTHFTKTFHIDDSLEPPKATQAVQFTVEWVQAQGFKYGSAPWDACSLGMPSFVFDISDVSQIGSEEIALHLQQIQRGVEGPIHAYTVVDSSLLLKTRVLQENAFYPVEVRCLATRSLHDLSTLMFECGDDLSDDLEFVVATNEDVKQTLELVAPIFIDGPGRHFVDDNIPKAGAVLRYKNWILNGMSNNNILYVTKRRSSNKVLGFFLVAGQERRHADLSLMGVDPQNSPRGLGVIQLHKVLKGLRDLGFRTCAAQISTFDPAVLELYQGSGFTFRGNSFQTVFHWRR